MSARNPGRHRRPAPMVGPCGWPTPAHPEHAFALLPNADEEWLAASAADLWPSGEYEDILRETPSDEGGQS